MTTDVSMERPVTLADVARRSGVAVSTVSRALSRPGRVNDVTRERIERVAFEMGYTARTKLRTSEPTRTPTVALLVSDVTNPFYFDIIRGTQEGARAAGYGQLLVDTEESEDVEEHMLRTLRGSYDGVVIAAPRMSNERLTALAGQMPIVTINRLVEGVPSVIIDTPSGIEQAIIHLESLGHTRVAYLCGPTTSWSNATRWRAMTRAATHRGMTAVRLGPFPPTSDGGTAAADALVTSGATAALAFNDLLAIGVLCRLQDRRVRVPEDLSVVGCDNIFGSDFCFPPLTTLGGPTRQAGRVAVSMLLGRLEPRFSVGPRDRVLLRTTLTVRGSTGPAPVLDPASA